MKRKVKVLIKCPLGNVGEEFKFDVSGVWVDGYTGYLSKHHIEKWIKDGWLELIEDPETLEDLYNQYIGRLIKSVDADVKYVTDKEVVKHLVHLAQMRVNKILVKEYENVDYMGSHGEKLKVLNNLKYALGKL